MNPSPDVALTLVGGGVELLPLPPQPASAATRASVTYWENQFFTLILGTIYGAIRCSVAGWRSLRFECGALRVGAPTRRRATPFRGGTYFITAESTLRAQATP
jgi:hypothetical protein